jgi:glutaminyl-peptide cyclotransferase
MTSINRNTTRFIARVILILPLFWACQSPSTGPEHAPVDAPASGIAEPKALTWSVLNTFPHDTAAFTQGFELYKGAIIESTGLSGRSSLRRVDPSTGKVLLMKKVDSPVFSEGVTILRDTAYQLTWQDHLQLYKAGDLSPIRRAEWTAEGWGITNDGTDLIISDGSDKLYFVRPGDLKLQRVVSVQDNLGPVNNLNELEYANGFLYANRWQYDYIEKIDPKSGHVVGRIDCKDILRKFSKSDLTYLTAPGSVGDQNGGVLNGIAWKPETGTFLITGKLWPNVFEIKVAE